MPVDHDYSAINAFPSFDRVTLSSADEADDFTLPSGPLLVSVKPVTNSCRVATSGTQGAQLTDDFVTVAGDSLLEVAVSSRQGAPTLYIDTANAGTVVEIILERPV